MVDEEKLLTHSSEIWIASRLETREQIDDAACNFSKPTSEVFKEPTEDRECRLWVKPGKPQYEHMLSAAHPRPDIVSPMARHCDDSRQTLARRYRGRQQHRRRGVCAG
jgi:hypothetical protein